MSYVIQDEKIYEVPFADLHKAALGAIGGLEGSVLKDDPEKGRLKAKFPKTILGNVLGDRTQLEVVFDKTSDSETKISLKIFPINPVGQELLFGARKGVPRKVLTWFIAHTEHRLKKE